MIENLLIVGCGSIGQRHARNAKSLGIKNIILFDVNLGRLKSFAEELGTDLYYVTCKELFKNNPEIDAAIIATPSALHIINAKFLAEKKIHIFIEKPLSHNLDGIADLIQALKRNNLVSMMGQSYRFHEGFLELKHLLDNNTLGKIYHVNYYGGQYLPDWHPEMDYRIEYSAKKELGGGVLLTTMSHIFDIIQWLFGDITDIINWKAKLSDLEIDVEDSVFSLIKTNRGIIINTAFDFLQRCQQHKLIITGELGHIILDLIKNEIKICKDDSNDIKSYNFDANRRYIEELKHFVNLVNGSVSEHEIDISTGKRILELILNSETKEID